MTRDHDRTIKIYHSAPILLRFKAGSHTLYHPQLDPQIFAPLVRIPTRKGTTQLVRRCLKSNCETCAATDVVSDLTLEVAKAHGIRGVPIKACGKARTEGERVADGRVRGAWMFGGGVGGAGEVGAGVVTEVEWQRFGGGGDGRVERWLEGLPVEFEGWESGPGGGEARAGARGDSPGVEGEGRLDDGLPVGEDLRDFFARRGELERRLAEGARSQTRALEARAGAGGEGPGVEGEGRLDDGLQIVERLKDFFARRGESERRLAKAARNQTRALEAEWRKSFESSAAAPWHLPAPLLMNATPWNGTFAIPSPAYPLQSRVPVYPQVPFGSNTWQYTKPITHPNKLNHTTNPPLTGPPLNTKAPKPLKPSLTEPHQAHNPLPFIPSGTTEANIQYYIKDLEAYMSAQGFASPRPLKPPMQSVIDNKPPPVFNSATSSTMYQTGHHNAAAPPPFVHRLGAGPRAGARPGFDSSQRMPHLAHPVLPATSSLGTKRACSDAGWAAQERRQKIRRLELQSGA
ncbi:hypothetical protein LTR91_004237 [Friedmanniomyces endolithicus]|uniref:Uncharacterized protein n=1 Tax=Friedmanniomyces endolithicus TaxID=329885 RepID=A0AAN6KV00_9PEZI|nr:hypothetical protein LTR59_013330 [Friedmanniomyces endolithicus]KAK0786297.1 hypothetical protein LTR38_012042 [Friedmanniomyces endolithicus]KAK0814594.1 hypothetical protein LTR75_004106 [Friedmanniomyces endolithicus]KAK0855242.1 hypothetical protein LTR03_002008 [Friedmanniomyces endolithicus]KAK0860732.1 hypothetical protein LTS02_008298 [Friedmanniomyces endolithicus]